MTNHIALITSLGCSLKCEYCYLAKDEEKIKHLELQKANIQALQDGTFVKNVRHVLVESQISPESINEIAFWGMEPTLTLKYITQNINQWFELFPNWNFCFFSTNGQQNYQDIFNFAQAASEYCITIFNMDIQVSYDGYKFTDQNRHVKIPNYLQELQNYMNNQIDSLKKYNFHIHFFPHGVLTHDKVKYLLSLSIDELITYFENEKKYCFKDQQTNYFWFQSNIGYAAENPCVHSKKDGQEIAQLLNKMFLSNYAFLKKQALELLGTFLMSFIKFPDNLILPINEMMTYCGNFTERYYIRYDGIIVQCAALPLKDKTKDIPLINYNFFYNIDNNNIEKNFYDNYWTTLNYESNVFQYNNIKNNIQILAKYNEIDPIYLTLDELTLDRHIRYIMLHNSCLNGFYSLTNSALTNPISHVKLYCNGLAFLLDQHINILIKNGWININGTR